MEARTSIAPSLHRPIAPSPRPPPPPLPALLAGRAQPASLPLAVGAAGLADVVVAVTALALGVEQEGEWRAAADAAALVEAALP